MVRVLGTHFAVQQQAADTLVTVLEGRVALGPATNAEQVFNPLVELRPNQQLSLQEAQQGVHPHAVNAKAALAWRRQTTGGTKTTLGRGVTRPQALLPRCDLSSRPLFGRARNHSCQLQIGALDMTLAALCQTLGLTPQYSADRRSVTLKKPQT